MQILQISGASPSRSGDGRTATFATVRAVCRAGHRITYAYLPNRASAKDPGFAAELLRACGGNLKLLPLRRPVRWMQKPLQGLRAVTIASALLGPRIHFGLLTKSLATVDKIRRLTCLMHGFGRGVIRQLELTLARQRFDVIQVDYPWMVSIAGRLPAWLPKLFVAHEIQTEIVQQAYPEDELLHDSVRNFETLQLRHYDAVATFSCENAELLRRVLRLPHVYYSPLAIDCSHRRPVPETVDSQGQVRFTFLGGHGHRPNVDAVEWLCREIVPQLRAAFGQMKLQVIGSYPPAFVKALAAADVSFVGFVHDLGNLIPGSIFLCPVRLGSGMRIKIVDAILRGAAVISTTVGACGLGLTAGKHYLAADSPADFARAALRLAKDDSFRKRICTAAQEQVVATFSAEAAGRKRIAVLEEAIQIHSSPHASRERKAA